MHFPVAGIDVEPWVPPLVALVVSFITSTGGVSGAFLLLPFQISVLGYTHPSVSATNHVFNVTAIPAGIHRYLREGRMVWPLTAVICAGTLPGVVLGALVRVRYLPDPQRFKLFAAGVLLYIGLCLMRDLVRSRSGKRRSEPTTASSERTPLPPVQVTEISFRRLAYRFGDDTLTVPLPSLFALSLIVGLVGGAYGIGGGAMMAPLLVAFYRLPVHTVAGAALASTFTTSVAAVITFHVMAASGAPVAPDWRLGLLFGVGGIVGMDLGARAQRFVPEVAIKTMLAVVVLAVTARYVAEFFTG